MNYLHLIYNPYPEDWGVTYYLKAFEHLKQVVIDENFDVEEITPALEAGDTLFLIEGSDRVLKKLKTLPALQTDSRFMVILKDWVLFKRHPSNFKKNLSIGKNLPKPVTEQLDHITKTVVKHYDHNRGLIYKFLLADQTFTHTGDALRYVGESAPDFRKLLISMLTASNPKLPLLRVISTYPALNPFQLVRLQRMVTELWEIRTLPSTQIREGNIPYLHWVRYKHVILNIPLTRILQLYLVFPKSSLDSLIISYSLSLES